MIAASQWALADGVYVTAGVGTSKAASSAKSSVDNILISEGAIGLSSSMSSGTSMAGGIGYAFGEKLAVEAGYFNSGTLAYTGTASGIGVSADVKVTAMQIALIGSLPLNDKFSFYGKIGYSSATTDTTARVGPASASTSDKNNGATYGVGAMYKVSNQFSIRAGYEQYASDLTGFMLGAQLKF
jgi:opacity protein-like surface antigen